WTMKMMLDQLLPDMDHGVVVEVISEMLVEGKILTPDLKGSATTQQVGDAICEKLTARMAAQ
ncbi:MAG: hypothetical protein Q7I98_08420, partial [Erysipelotrichaceae bacterium]|nr:hypothetical protein [Erysipelotrichaceae bacterium]